MVTSRRTWRRKTARLPNCKNGPKTPSPSQGYKIEVRRGGRGLPEPADDLNHRGVVGSERTAPVAAVLGPVGLAGVRPGALYWAQDRSQDKHQNINKTTARVSRGAEDKRQARGALLLPADLIPFAWPDRRVTISLPFLRLLPPPKKPKPNPPKRRRKQRRGVHAHAPVAARRVLAERGRGAAGVLGVVSAEHQHHDVPGTPGKLRERPGGAIAGNRVSSAVVSDVSHCKQARGAWSGTPTDA